MFGIGRCSVTLDDILSRVSEGDILSYYLGITKIPTVINSPLRMDKKPSFGLNSTDGKKVHYIDWATNEKGGTFDLLSKLWGVSFSEVLTRIYNDIDKIHSSISIDTTKRCTITRTTTEDSSSTLKCRIREWKEHDIAYWESYGISLPWLKYADIYPISHKIVEKDNKTFVFGADKYAYVYVERKDGKVSLKIYQPYNTNGYKWSNKHDGSVISLWTKVPEYGDKICICSSVKDALCLWANTGIPSIAIQGEGYNMSDTAINELRKRFKEVFILLDNDKPGLSLANKLAQSTGFKNIILPQFEGGKDISDFYKVLTDKQEFNKVMLPLFS